MRAARQHSAQRKATRRGFNLSAGSYVNQCVVRQNVTGILAADGCTVEHCTVTANSDDGIRVANRCHVRANTAYLNTNDGIEATGSENRIEDNESSLNGVGIAIFGSSNLVVRNSASANTNTEFMIVGGGNKVGTISVDPTTAGPWANFDL